MPSEKSLICCTRIYDYICIYMIILYMYIQAYIVIYDYICIYMLILYFFPSIHMDHVYVRVYVCVYICVYIHIYAHIRTCAHVYMYICIYIHTYIPLA